MTRTPHIAVIGAGMAGLSCATHLQQAGLRVSVFDKSRGLGGRMSTRRGEGWQCDHGAQYFTARSPEFRTEVARWQESGVAALWMPALSVLGDSGQHKPEAGLERFVGVPRMSAPAGFLARELTVSTQVTVQQLQRQPSGSWKLLSIEQGLLEEEFDAVLLAIPSAQAAVLLQEPLPELAASAAQTAMRACWALMLNFAGPVDMPFSAAFVNRGPLRWLARDNSKPGRPDRETWLLHANAEWSEAHLEDDGAEIAALLQQAFTELGGPAAQSWSIHRWRYADTASQRLDGCVWDAGNRVGLCGDWINGGKVEGAWLSGLLLGRQVAQTLG